jgi:threonine/homoserine/homoserine lactone efflux protein
MFRELMLVVPMGFAAALSPMMLTEQTVLLAGHRGRQAADRYALGTALVTVVYVGALVAWGRAISLPTRPTLSATMDVVAGVVLVLVAAIIRRRPPRRTRERPARTEMGPGAAFGFGVFSMATNFTSLAVLLPAAKDIAASSMITIGRIALIVVLVVLATMPAWIPIAATKVAPGPAERALTSLSRLISRYGRNIAVVLVAALGFVLIGRGALHIVTT